MQSGTVFSTLNSRWQAPVDNDLRCRHHNGVNTSHDLYELSVNMFCKVHTPKCYHIAHISFGWVETTLMHMHMRPIHPEQASGKCLRLKDKFRLVFQENYFAKQPFASAVSLCHVRCSCASTEFAHAHIHTDTQRHHQLQSISRHRIWAWKLRVRPDGVSAVSESQNMFWPHLIWYRISTAIYLLYGKVTTHSNFVSTDT